MVPPMQDVNDNPTSPGKAEDGKTPQGLAMADRKGVDRRRFLLAGAAAPVVLTLANRPAFALTNCDPCGFVQLQTSLNPSAQVRSAACGGSTPLYWRSTPGAWNETNYRAGRPTIVQAQGSANGRRGGKGDDDSDFDSEEGASLLLSLAAQAAAAVLNATDARRSRYAVEVRVIIEMYSQVESRGYYTTATGSKMPEDMVLAFLMNTYA